MKSLKSIREVSAFRKSNFIHPKWLHNDPKVVVKSHRATRIYLKWPQSASKSEPQVLPRRSGPLSCKLSLAYSWPLWPFKNALKTNGFLTFPLSASPSPYIYACDMHYTWNSTSICSKWPLNDPEVLPKSPSYAKTCPKMSSKQSRSNPKVL